MAWLRLPVPSHPGQHPGLRPTALPLPPPRGLGQGPGPGAAGRGASGVLAGAPEAWAAAVGGSALPSSEREAPRPSGRGRAR